MKKKKPGVIVYKGPENGDLLLKTVERIHEKRNGDFELKSIHSEDSSYITVGDNMIMRAVPEGKLEEIFSSALDLADDPGLSHLRETLSVITRKVMVKIYVTSFCPFCGSVMNELIPLIRLNRNVTVEIIDGGLYTELAENDTIKASPTVIFDGKFRWTAGFKRDEFVEAMCAENPLDMSIAAQKKMIESGEAGYLADLMLHSRAIFPSFYNLLFDEKWPTRLGAMVAAEKIAGENRKLGETILDNAWSFYDKADNSVKGDIIYLTGETGTRDNVERLKGILDNGASPELIEAALEAVESILLRCNDV